VAAVLTIAWIAGGAGAVHGQYYYYRPSEDYHRNDTAEGTVTGGVFGAITGALLGGRKNRGGGALIGAGVGALAGNLLGRGKDQQDAHRAAVGAAVVARANRQVAARAVTNSDLVRMTQAGVGDDLIISTIRARGARLDLGPQSLIALKESGVSDRVMIAAQDMTRGRPTAPIPTRTAVVTERVPPAVILTPAPRWGSHCAPPHYYPRARVHYHVRF